ncbi:PAQR family membrane homeostasis protein TrhA [Bradyrhizobium sp. JYMT SZCCT0428]|jgi:hemolysin III|uniref:PAQR family membrane homeostasis protein TrhA n=1 Tax=Bradyrhizobium sp. JYMT SZCCT0428 TaxID=2807673 RepID=UPI001BA92912|nr:hemolysin III family protein [Bradyrhizobium sp. JYMT SZCCT0428]MBR1153135.1 hemolysin III family protein [Bradyrhizobium sp. JYMT SZCCT0428]
MQQQIETGEPNKPVSDNQAPVARHPTGAIPWNYDRAEIIADGVIHSLGISLGLGAASTLIVLATYSTTPIRPGIIAVYALCLLTMLGMSAAYNLWPLSPQKWLFRRFDQSAIYLLIAATYTPFLSQLNDSKLSTCLLVALWSSAVVGIAVRLVFPGRFDTFSVVLYVAMGWSGIIAYDNARASLPVSILAFIAVGGLLYTIGIIFHLWENLRFQNAIWHGFVLMGAGCHFTAVLDLVIRL